MPTNRVPRPADLAERSILAPESVERVAADRHRSERRMWAMLEDLRPMVGHDRMVAVENAVIDYMADVQLETTARLLGVLVALNQGDSDVFVAP